MDSNKPEPKNKEFHARLTVALNRTTDPDEVTPGLIDGHLRSMLDIGVGERGPYSIIGLSVTEAGTLHDGQGSGRRFPRLAQCRSLADLCIYLEEERALALNWTIEGIVAVTGCSREHAEDIVLSSSLDREPTADADGGTNFSYGQYMAWDELLHGLRAAANAAPQEG